MKRIEDVERTYKIIWIGNSGVGKTCLLQKAMDASFIEGKKSTLGFDYQDFIIKVNYKKILLQTWDTCGQEKFNSLVNIFYKRANLILLVYSIDDKSSFNSINFWLKEIHQKATEDVRLMLIGNKNDLKESREVSFEEGKNYADNNGFDYFCETSAKNEKANFIIRKAAEILYDYDRQKRRIHKNYIKHKLKLDEKSNINNISLDMPNCIDCF